MGNSTIATTGVKRTLQSAYWRIGVTAHGVWRYVSTARSVTSATVNSITDNELYSPNYPHLGNVDRIELTGYDNVTTGDSAILYIVSGTGAGQYRIVTDIPGNGNVIEVRPDFDTVPNETSTYTLHPVLTGTSSKDYNGYFYFEFQNRDDWGSTFDAITGKAKLQLTLKKEVFKQWNPDDTTDLTVMNSPLQWALSDYDGTSGSILTPTNYKVSRQTAFDVDGNGECSTDDGEITLPYVIEFDVTDIVAKNITTSNLYIGFVTVNGKSRWIYDLTVTGSQVLAEVSSEFYVTGKYAPSLFITKSDGSTIVLKSFNDYQYPSMCNVFQGTISSATLTTVTVTETYTENELQGGYLRLVTDIGLFAVYEIASNTADTITINGAFEVLPTSNVSYEVCFKRTPDLVVVPS